MAPVSQFLTIINDKQQFTRMRQDISSQPTSQQSQVTLSAATADLDNNPVDGDSIDQTNIAQTKDKNNTELEKKLIIHYTHEKRLHPFKRNMHRIYDNTFGKQIDTNIKMIVGSRNRPNAQKELIRKKPKQALLKKQTKTCESISYFTL